MQQKGISSYMNDTPIPNTVFIYLNINQYCTFLIGLPIVYMVQGHYFISSVD